MLFSKKLLYFQNFYPKIFTTPGVVQSVILAPGVYEFILRGGGGSGGTTGPTVHSGPGGDGGAGTTSPLVIETVTISRAVTAEVYVGEGGRTYAQGGNGGAGGGGAGGGGAGGGSGGPSAISFPNDTNTGYIKFYSGAGAGGGGGGCAGGYGREAPGGGGGGGGGSCLFLPSASNILLDCIQYISGATGGTGRTWAYGTAGGTGTVANPDVSGGRGGGGSHHQTGAGGAGGSGCGAGGGAGNGGDEQGDTHSSARGGGGGGGSGGWTMPYEGATGIIGYGGFGGYTNSNRPQAQNGTNANITPDDPTTENATYGMTGNYGMGGAPDSNGVSGFIIINKID